MQKKPNQPAGAIAPIAPTTALANMAKRLEVSENLLVSTLKKTAFSECKTDEEFAACVIVANEYELNPLLREIYAFPKKGGGVVPVVGVDGWLRVINRHSQFDGIDEEMSEDGSWCRIGRARSFIPNGSRRSFAIQNLGNNTRAEC